jgi:phage tail sheath protein FI
VTEYIHPGVFVEEVSFRSKTIAGVSTSTAGFVGVSSFGPTDNPALVTGLDDYDRRFGDTCALRGAVKAFFDSGGTRLFVQLVAGPEGLEEGLRAFEGVDVAVVAAPGAPIARELVEHAERMRYRFAVLDAPAADIDSSYGASHRAEGLDGPASAYAAGIYTRSPNRPSAEVTDPGADGTNLVRRLADGAFAIAGNRTLSSDPEWKYVNIRRYFIYLEHSIDRGTQWAVFEPNGDELWAGLRRAIADFLLDEWQQGALLGRKPEEAFFVRCDRSTMTQDDLDDGRLVCLVGVAPLKPAEFVIIRIGRWTADHSCR